MPESQCVIQVPKDNGGGTLLCVRCEGSAYESLLSHAANIFSAVTGCEAGEVEEEDLGQGVGVPGWRELLLMTATVRAGPFAGASAIGSGGAVRTRRRTSKLAVALEVLMRDQWTVRNSVFNDFPLLQQLCEEAWNSPVLPAAFNEPRLPQPPAAAPAQPSAPPAPEAAPWGGAAPSTCTDLALIGIPEECLRDPLMELRPWNPGAGDGSLWPYCAGCGLWSDPSHLGSRRHQKKLEYYGHAAHVPAPSLRPPPLAPWGPQPAQLALPQPPPVPAAAAPQQAPWREEPAAPAWAAPRKPLAAEVFDWNYAFVSFDWREADRRVADMASPCIEV